MTNLRQIATVSGTRPKGLATKTPPKKPQSNRDPKTVKDVVERLRQLGPYPVVTGLYAAEDYDALTRRRLDWISQRKHLLALKHELGKKTDNDAIAARGTVALADGDSPQQQNARRNATRVKQSEAWRYKQLDGLQRQAEQELERVIRAMRGGPSLVANYGRVGGGNDHFSVSAGMEQDYGRWRIAASNRYVLIEAVLDCIAEPVTMAEIERMYGIAAGHGIANHRNGLDIWAEIRGWTTRKAARPGA